jgi:4-hydroxybenzoyl-CoA reductase subunit beta
MRLPKFQLIQPGSLEEACSSLGEHRGEASLLAGGTALVVDLRQRLRKPSYVISMKGVGGLDYIRPDEGGGLRIGALVTVEDLAHSPLVMEGYPLLVQAARSIGVPPLRHMGTVGGNLSLDTRCIYYNQSELWRRARPTCLKLGGEVCHAVEKGRRCLAVYQGDLAPALMALGARVRLVRAGGERVIPLQEFFTGKGEKPHVLEGDEILAEVQIPSPSSNGASAYEKLRVREAMDFPLVSAAVSLRMSDQGTIAGANIVLGAVASAPLEVSEGQNALVGKKVGDGLDALLEEVAQQAFDKAHPVDNLAIGADYRRKMAKVLVRRALARSLAPAHSG